MPVIYVCCFASVMRKQINYRMEEVSIFYLYQILSG